MKLYIGGAYQGQAELAARENPGAVLVDHYHETLRQVVLAGEDPKAHAEKLLREQPDAVVVADEIGMGIVPMDPADRAWREGAGRALCLLAQHAQSVTRVTCGLGVRIK